MATNETTQGDVNSPASGEATGTPSVVGITDGGVVEVPGGLPLGDASFGHAGPNLVITWPDGTEVVVEDFFAADPAPAPVTELSTDDLVNGFSTPLRFLPMRSGSENDYGLQSKDAADAGDDDLGDEDLGDLADFETAAGAEDPGAGAPEGLGAPGSVVGGDYGQTGGGDEEDLGLGGPGGDTGGDDGDDEGAGGGGGGDDGGGEEPGAGEGEEGGEEQAQGGEGEGGLPGGGLPAGGEDGATGDEEGGEEQTAGKDGDGEDGESGFPGGEFPGAAPQPGEEPVEGDVIVGTNRSEVLRGTEGNDDISALRGHDRVLGGDGDDVIRGTWSGDTLDFSETELTGIEEIDGSYGHDRITGSAGDDVIRGGAHNDRLAGGGGDDTFMVGSGDGADTILDFLVNDALVFEGESFVDAFLADSSNLRIEQDGDDAVVSFAGVNGVSVRLSGVDADQLEGYATTEDEGGSVVVAFDGSVG